jgi:hypothetical protein
VALVAAIVVLGVILLAVGDDGSSTGARPALDSPADKTPPAEEPGAREEPAAPSEPPQGSGKPKKKDAPKKQPGTGKGRGKD